MGNRGDKEAVLVTLSRHYFIWVHVGKVLPSQSGKVGVAVKAVVDK